MDLGTPCSSAAHFMLVPFLMASNAANMEHSLHCLRLPRFLGERRTAGADRERSLFGLPRDLLPRLLCEVGIAAGDKIKHSTNNVMPPLRQAPSYLEQAEDSCDVKGRYSEGRLPVAVSLQSRASPTGHS